MLTAISKMKEPSKGGSRIAIIHNGSPLFTGDAGSGPSEIRRYILENDLLEAIIALPNDIFYNTGIATYIWVLSNKKSGTKREGKVQLINANGLFEKRRKALGNKRNDIPESAIEEITSLYGDFKENEISKIFNNEDFGYTKITVERPVRYSYTITDNNVQDCACAFVEDEKLGWGWNDKEPYGVTDSETVKCFVSDIKNSILNIKFLSQNEFEVALKPLITKYSLNKKQFNDLELAFRQNDSQGEVFINTRTGKMVADSELRDTENVPLTEDIKAYFEREVLPFAPDAWIDEKKSKVGYEIPFTRYFYKYEAPKPSNEIMQEILAIESELDGSLKEIFS